jgi:hypothetical protein
MPQEYSGVAKKIIFDNAKVAVKECFGAFAKVQLKNAQCSEIPPKHMGLHEDGSFTLR